MASGDVVTGKSGAVTLDAVARVLTSFAITETGSTLDVTDSSDSASGYRAKEIGKFKQWSGTLEYILKIADATIALNTSVAFIGTAVGGVTYTGDVSFTEVTDTIPVEAEEVVKVTVNFEGLGVLTKANSA